MIPNLPTDNLYKFIALSGVFLLCFSMYFVKDKIYTLGERVYEENLKIAELTIKINFFKEDISAFKKLSKNTVLAQQGKLQEDNSKISIYINDAEFKELRRTIKSKQLQIQIDSEKIKISLKYTQHLLNEVESYNNQLYFWSITFLLMSAYGFQMWYKKVQKPLDLKIATEFENNT